MIATHMARQSGECAALGSSYANAKVEAGNCDANIPSTRGSTLTASSTSLPTMGMQIELGTAVRVKKGEDMHSVRREVIGGERVLLVMVADGHGGNVASMYCRDRLFDLFIETAGGDASSSSLQEAGRDAFRRAHAEVRAIRGCTAGCTLTLCAVNEHRGELTCCNAGDTLAYIFSSEQPDAPELVSEDHRLDHCESECARLKALGGRLGKAVGHDGLPGGPKRVFPGGLAVARGIGDADCADFVSCEPAVTTRTLPKHFVILVATDGLWDGPTLEQVTKIALKTRQPEAFAKKLLKLSVKLRGLFDDMTCVVIQRTPPSSGSSTVGIWGPVFDSWQTFRSESSSNNSVRTTYREEVHDRFRSASLPASASPVHGHQRPRSTSLPPIGSYSLAEFLNICPEDTPPCLDSATDQQSKGKRSTKLLIRPFTALTKGWFSPKKKTSSDQGTSCSTEGNLGEAVCPKECTDVVESAEHDAKVAVSSADTESERVAAQPPSSPMTSTKPQRQSAESDASIGSPAITCVPLAMSTTLLLAI